MCILHYILYIGRYVHNTRTTIMLCHKYAYACICIEFSVYRACVCCTLMDVTYPWRPFPTALYIRARMHCHTPAFKDIIPITRYRSCLFVPTYTRISFVARNINNSNNQNGRRIRVVHESDGGIHCRSVNA